MDKAVDPQTPLAEQPSASALNVAICRALAVHVPRAAIRGRDTLAEYFLDAAGRASLVNPAIHAVIQQKMYAVSPGGYEFFLARTAYLDAVYEQALHDNIPQIVLLGAGYDTRAYRFRDLIQETRIFDLDTPATQAHKTALLEAAGVTAPPQRTNVSIDFNHERLIDALTAAGYAPGRKTLFIWEGVTYYLPLATVDATLSFIVDNAAPGSILGFDYMIADDLTERFGASESRAAMQAMYTAEPLHFGLAIANVESFMAARGFDVVEHITAAEMEQRYLVLEDGTLAGRVLDLFGLVQAVVRAA
ncbi:MAG: class I SAM-dependent methyltransferase [Anaerolineae bacterium]|nr:class I SAM-dependent methyltransferase [Anaerolineae bacterium]